VGGSDQLSRGQYINRWHATLTETDASTRSSEPFLLVKDPSTKDVIERVSTATPEQVQAAVDRSRRAQRAWARQPVAARCQRLLSWRHSILNAGDLLASQLSRENGKPLHEAWLHELVPLCDTLSWLADNAPRMLEDTDVRLRWMKHQHSRLWSKPRGLCAVISPYNFPLLIPFADAAAALIAGCSVIVKPSELTPSIARHVARLAHESGLDEDLLQILIGGPDVARQLIASDVDEVVFTGGSDHGRDVALRCADRLVPCTLELGGRAPLMVLDDADVDDAATAIVFGSLANSGQSCIAVERVFAPSRMCPRLLDGIVDRVKSLRQGNPLLAEVDLGAMTSSQHIDEVARQVTEAVAGDADLLCGGRLGEQGGNFYLPTVLGNCRPDLAVIAEETFGPVIPIVPIDSLQSALEVANQGRASLAAYLFGRDEDALNRAARSVKANHVMINDVLWSYLCPELPFGGQGQNGWGVVHGPEGLLSHTYRAHVGSRRLRLPAKLALGFPYSKTPRTMVKHALRLLGR
jgi:acyl-CoA reductase-like NAD-dependent aldehyde dehydrogenase